MKKLLIFSLIFSIFITNNLLLSKPYKEIIDKKNIKEQSLAGFSGDYIIMRKDNISYGKDKFGDVGLHTRCNFFSFNIFSPMEDKLINTIPYNEIIAGTELEPIFNDNCSEDFFLNWFKDHSVSKPIKVVSNGNIMAVLFTLSYNFTQQYVKVFNLITGETLFTYKMFQGLEPQKISKGYYANDIFMDNEKIVIFNSISIPIKYKYKCPEGYENICNNPSLWTHLGPYYSVSFYYYQTGEFKEDYFTWTSANVLKSIENFKKDIVVEEFTPPNYDDIINDNMSEGFYSFSKEIRWINKNFILLSHSVIDLANKKILPYIQGYYIGDTLEYSPDYVDESGNLYYIKYKEKYSDTIQSLIKYNPKDKSKETVYSDESFNIGGFIFDNNTIYLLNSKITLRNYSIPYKKFIYINKNDAWIKVGKIFNETKEVGDANGIPFYPVPNQIGYNLYKINNISGETERITGDFPFENFDFGKTVFIKNNTLLAYNHHIYEFSNKIDKNCLKTTELKCPSGLECTSEKCPKEAHCICRRFEIKNISNDNKTFLFIGNIHKLKNFNKRLTVVPVIPSKSDYPSIFKEGAKFYRTYQIVNSIGKPVENAEITSMSGYESYTDEDGIVNVGNIFDLAPGNYTGYTVNNIIADINYDNNSVLFNYKKNGEDNFTIKVIDNSHTEKRMDMALGLGGSVGIGAFRAGTIRALSLDLTGKITTGIYFNQIKDGENFYLEIGRNLTTSAGVNSVLAEADLYGIADGKIESSINVAGTGSQAIILDDPFLSSNEKSREILTAFLWDTLVRNETLFFPGAFKIVSWIWDKVDPFDIKDKIYDSKGGLQISGSATAGVELPALKVAGGNAALKSGNLENIGIKLPSVSMGFAIEEAVHEYQDINDKNADSLGVEININTSMPFSNTILKNIMNYSLPFSPVIDIPPLGEATFDLLAKYNNEIKLSELNFDFTYEYKNGKSDNFYAKEFLLQIKDINFSELVADLPDTIKKLIIKTDLDTLSLDTKNISQLYKLVIDTLAEHSSGEFLIYKDNLTKTCYKLDLGLGAGLEFGVIAELNYFTHQKHLEKRYLIDSGAKGIALLEDFSNITLKYPQKTLSDIFGLTIEYLKDKIAGLFQTIKKVIEENKTIKFLSDSGKRIVEIGKGVFTTGWNIFVTPIMPISSDKTPITSSSIPLETLKALMKKSSLNSSSASIGKVLLINVKDENMNITDNFSPIKITFIYSDEDLKKVNLNETDENKFFMWKFRNVDHKYAKINFIINKDNNSITSDNITSNGIYGIGFDITPPNVKFLNVGTNGNVIDNHLIGIINDDFSGIDNDTLIIKLDNNSVEKYYDLTTGKFLIPNITKGSHTLTIFVKDTANNVFNNSYNLFFDIYDNMSDYDNDGVPNFMDKYPFDPSKSSDNNTQNENLQQIKISLLSEDPDLCSSSSELKLIFTSLDNYEKYYSYIDNCSMTIDKFYPEKSFKSISGLPYGDYKVDIVLNSKEFTINNAFELNGTDNILTGSLSLSENENKALHILKGWNLIGIPVNTSFKTGKKLQKSSTIWGWNDNKWHVWSPKQSIINLLGQYKVNILTELNAGYGYWINSSEEFTETFTGDVYGLEKLKLNKGWNLLGIGKDTTPDNFSDISTLWQWNGANWKIWSPENSILNLLKNYKIEIADKIKAGEGFWVNK